MGESYIICVIITFGSVADGRPRGGAVGGVAFWEIIKFQNSWVVVYFCYIYLQNQLKFTKFVENWKFGIM